ncbi:MAG: PEP-CTERM sorting domain-containing protein [Phycisphaerae bacterium]
MRKNVLLITAGVFGSLAVSASADFTRFQTEFKRSFDTALSNFGEDVGIVDIWNLYALFNDPDDVYTATFVVPDTSMIHSSDLFKPFDGLGGGFWNNVTAPPGNTPQPAGFVYDLDRPGFDNDTFLTIGLKAGFEGDQAADFDPEGEGRLNASGIMSDSGELSEDFAYFTIPEAPQAAQVGGRVLVLQIAVLQGEHASGIWNVQWGNLGPGPGGGQASGVQWTTVPAPGALALLGLAGLAGARRRRRG